MVIFCADVTSAQENAKMRQVYAQAESDYQIGHIEQARDTLLHTLNVFRGNLCKDALRPSHLNGCTPGSCPLQPKTG